MQGVGPVVNHVGTWQRVILALVLIAGVLWGTPKKL